MANAWIEETLPQTISTLTTQLFKSQFSALTTNADRVQFCKAQKEVQRWVGLFVSKFAPNQNVSKCTTTAGKYREKGNDHFRGQNFESALQLYSKAICFAPQSVDKAPELALAFGNRSAVYLQLGQYDNALKDIDAALTFGYGRCKSIVKLQLRKCDCLIRLGRASEAKEFLNFMQQPTSDEKETKRWSELFGQISLGDNKKKDSNPKAGNVSLIAKLTNKGLFKSNKKMPLFSTKVAVHYDEVKGRHLVAQEDIEFGDILAVSRPYVTLLNPKDDALKYCDCCCRDTFHLNLTSIEIRPIPCTDCSSVVFCSECINDATNSYHRYECGQHDLLAQLPKFAQMSLRLLYRAGMDQIRSVVDSPEDSNHISEQPDDHYSHVYQLVHHSDGPLKNLDIFHEEMLKSSILACLLLQIAKNTNFPMDTKDEEKLIGGILLRHLLQSRFNTFDYSPFNESSSSSPVLSELYPMYASTLNHSCKANARLESADGQHVCLLQAARSIPAGTQITISYFEDQKFDPFVFYESRISHRQQKLRFYCNCAKCTYEIRNMPFGVFDYYPLQCDDCGNLIERFSEHSSISEVFRCTICPLEMTNSQVKQRYVRAEELLNILAQFQHRFGRSFLKTIVDNSFWSEFAPIIDEIEISLYRDWSIVFGVQLLSFSYLHLGYLELWWHCHERFLSVIEHHFGAESVQFIQAFGMIQRLHQLPLANPIFRDLMENCKETYLARLEQYNQLKLKTTLITNCIN